MLSISSTVVIKRSFDELGVRGEKYTNLVMGTLIMEDVLSIFIMKLGRASQVCWCTAVKSTMPSASAEQ